MQIHYLLVVFRHRYRFVHSIYVLSSKRLVRISQFKFLVTIWGEMQNQLLLLMFGMEAYKNTHLISQYVTQVYQYDSQSYIVCMLEECNQSTYKYKYHMYSIYCTYNLSTSNHHTKNSFDYISIQFLLVQYSSQQFRFELHRQS